MQHMIMHLFLSRYR